MISLINRRDFVALRREASKVKVTEANVQQLFDRLLRNETSDAEMVALCQYISDNEAPGMIQPLMQAMINMAITHGLVIPKGGYHYKGEPKNET